MIESFPCHLFSAKRRTDPIVPDSFLSMTSKIKQPFARRDVSGRFMPGGFLRTTYMIPVLQAFIFSHFSHFFPFFPVFLIIFSIEKKMRFSKNKFLSHLNFNLILSTETKISIFIVS